VGAVWLWARRDLARGWRSLAVVTLVAALAGGAVLAAVAGARRADTAVDRSLDQGSFYEVSAFATEPIPETMEWLESNPQVAALDEFRVLMAGPIELTPGLDGAMLVPSDATTFDSIRMVAGRPPRGQAELIVSERTARRLSMGVGDKVPFHYVPFEQQEACLQEPPPCSVLAPIGELIVSGIFGNPSELTADQGQNVFAAAPELLASLGPVEQITPARWVHVGLHDRSDAAAVTAELSTRLPEGDVTNEVAVLDPARRAAGVLATGLRVAATVAALAALVATAQTASRHFAIHRDETLSLAALGMTRGGRTLGGALPAVCAAAVAGVAAVGVAVALSPAFPLGLARRADPDPGWHADWLVLVPGAVVVALAAGAVCVVAAWRRARVTWAGRGPRTRLSLVARWAEQLGLSPVPTAGARFALEVKRGGGSARAGQVLVTVGLVVGVVVGSLVVRDSLNTLLGSPDRYGVVWDLAIDLPDRGPPTMAVVDDLAQDQRVGGAALVSAGELTVRSGSGASQVPAVGTATLSGRMAPVVLQGRAPEGPDEVMVGPATMDDLGLAVGDEVVLDGAVLDGAAPEASGSSGGPEQRTVRVVGRGVLPLAITSDVDEGLMLPLATFDELGGEQLVADIDARSAMLMDVPDDADRDAIRTELESAYGDLLWQPSRPVDVSVLDELTPVPAALAGFAAVLGTIVTAQALAGGVRRRRGELAIMRALGLRPTQVARVVVCQATVLAGVALVAGVPAGIVAGRFVWRAVARGANIVPVTDVPTTALVVLCAAVGLIALTAAAVPARRAARLRPAQALRAE
jgi:FtsX-like permease family